MLYMAAYGTEASLMRYLATTDLAGIDSDLNDEDGCSPEDGFKIKKPGVSENTEKQELRGVFSVLVSAVRLAWRQTSCDEADRTGS